MSYNHTSREKSINIHRPRKKILELIDKDVINKPLKFKKIEETVRVRSREKKYIKKTQIKPLEMKNTISKMKFIGWNEKQIRHYRRKY